MGLGNKTEDNRLLLIIINTVWHCGIILWLIVTGNWSIMGVYYFVMETDALWEALVTLETNALWEVLVTQETDAIWEVLAYPVFSFKQ